MRAIEFLGAQGAGKSTLRRATTLRLQEDGVSAQEFKRAVLMAAREAGRDPITRSVARICRSHESRIWRRTIARSTEQVISLSRFLAEHPAVMEVILAAQRRRADRDLEQERVLWWILDLMARYQLVQSSTSGIEVVLIDEGFTQRAIALLAYGFDGEGDVTSLEQYVEAMPKPDLVVLVEARIERSLDRLATKEWPGRLEGLDADSRRRFVGEAQETAVMVAAHIEKAGVPVVRVDGTASVDVNVPLVLAAFRDDLKTP